MAESAYAVVSKTIGSNPVWVQVPLKPPNQSSPLPSPKTSPKESPDVRRGPRLILSKKSRILHIFFHSSLLRPSKDIDNTMFTCVRGGLKIRRPLRSWGFDPPSRHQQNKDFRLNWPLESQRPKLFGGCFDHRWFSSKFCSQGGTSWTSDTLSFSESRAAVPITKLEIAMVRGDFRSARADH